MYASSLGVQNFRVFGESEVDLRHPGRLPHGTSFPNINVFLGDNGGGKSSILRAVALACLSPVLLETGFVPYRLVRRPRSRTGHVKVRAEFQDIERKATRVGSAELTCHLERREKSDIDIAKPDDVCRDMLEPLLFDDESPALFVVGYGATRRVETGDFSESSARKRRGARYQRVSSLFEEQVTLSMFNQRSKSRGKANRNSDAIRLLNLTLPNAIRCDRLTDDGDLEFVVEQVRTPFASLSDGFRAFVGWVGDLIGQLADVAGADRPLTDIPGIVMVDEIDLHLHPSWQRSVVPTLSSVFPNLQFLFTSHSALVAGSVTREHVFVTGKPAGEGGIVRQLGEKTFGRSADQLLLSGYFGLETTRSPQAENEAEELFERAADGDPEAALAFLRRMNGSQDWRPGETLPRRHPQRSRDDQR